MEHLDDSGSVHDHHTLVVVDAGLRLLDNILVLLGLRLLELLLQLHDLQDTQLEVEHMRQHKEVQVTAAPLSELVGANDEQHSEVKQASHVLRHRGR